VEFNSLEDDTQPPAFLAIASKAGGFLLQACHGVRYQIFTYPRLFEVV